MTAAPEPISAVEYAIPEGCPVCAGDLHVKVSPAGPNGVCLTCGYLAKPTIGVTHRGLKVELRPQADA